MLIFQINGSKLEIHKEFLTLSYKKWFFNIDKIRIIVLIFLFFGQAQKKTI